MSFYYFISNIINSSTIMAPCISVRFPVVFYIRHTFITQQKDTAFFRFKRRDFSYT